MSGSFKPSIFHKNPRLKLNMDDAWIPPTKGNVSAKEMTVVLKLQLLTKHEYECGVSNHCVCDFDFD